MTVPVWVAELAALFWAEAGQVEPFPRDLRRSMALALPLSPVFLARLRVSCVLSALQRSGIICNLGGPDRELRACLVARNGQGLVFIDGSDPEAEQRFSLAHELAHFLRDYCHPRRLVCNRLGAAALEVLDGVRTATPEEHLSALLRHIPIGFHVHLMERDDDGKPASDGIANAEQCADRLAFELLAPAAHILSSCRFSQASYRHEALEGCLQREYGLPRRQAAKYAEVLLPARSPIDPLLVRLRNAR